MTDEHLNRILSLVYFSLLRRRSFELIMEKYDLNEKDLCAYISMINAKNNEFYPLVKKGEKIIIDYSEMTFRTYYINWKNPNKEMRLMFIADKHIGHIRDRLDYIYYGYEEGERRGVDHVFDLGDTLNGSSAYNNYRHASQCKTGTLEGSIELLMKHHPQNIPTHLITGNHDLSFMATDYVDIGRLIEKACPNIHFLNNLFTSVKIGNFVINFSHGCIEKKPIDQLNLQRECPFLLYNKPHIIAQAHFHQFSASSSANTILFGVPSLKPSLNSSDKHRISQAGVLFVTIKKVNNNYHIEYERVCFLEKKLVVKGDKVLTIGTK